MNNHKCLNRFNNKYNKSILSYHKMFKQKQIFEYNKLKLLIIISKQYVYT